MDTIDFSNPLVIAALAVAGFFVGKLLFRADDAIEERRRHAAEAAAKLSSLGFKKLPRIFIDYSIGDYSGMITGLRELVHSLHDPAEREAELAHVFSLLLTEKLKDPEKRKTLEKLVGQAKAAVESGDFSAATVDALAKSVTEVIKSGAIGGHLLSAQLPESSILHALHSPVISGLLGKLGFTPPASPAPASPAPVPAAAHPSPPAV